jgi:peroxiredoxin
VKADSHRVWRLAPIVALGMGSLLFSSSLVRGAGVSDVVQARGLSALEPPRPATDFELPRTGGGTGSLSQYSGKWVILTFWASWCGPCRSEMPSLESLHRSHGNQGVVVLGVSVDNERSAADGFAEQLGLSFPLLWDERGQVGNQYQATAIPMSYLVDPAGRVVALARGARDWTQLAGMLDELLALLPPSSQPDAVYAESLDLPTILNPPSAELALSTTSPEVGEEFDLDIRLQWAGHLEEYLPQPPKVHLPEGVEQRAVTASSNSRDGAQIVTYRVTLQASEPGTFALDPIELRYKPRMASDETATRLLGPTVTVEPRTVLGMAPNTLAIGAGGIAVAAMAGLAMGKWWKTRRQAEPPAAEADLEQMMARYNAARGLRMQGDGSGYALAMVELLGDLREPGEEESLGMAALEESLRYGGQVPPASELDRLQREVGRRLETLKPDPDAAARRAIRLQDDEERT